MLGTKTKPTTENKFPTPSNGSAAPGETCIVSAGTVIEGKFRASENVRLDGMIKGDVKCENRLVMGESGRIEGNVFTKDGIIMGTIEGEVRVSGTLTLKGSALIRGTIGAKYLVVEEGARYIGDCKVGE